MIDNGIHNYIHIQNLRANVRKCMTYCSSLLPIIKSDAYGHGIIHTTRVLEAEGIDLLAVGTVNEGVRLRRSGIRAGLVALLGAMNAEDARLAAELDIMPLLHSFDELALLENLSMPIDVVIKCDTGMRRLGFTLDELPALIDRIKSNQKIHPRIILSHLACSDECNQDNVTLHQMRTFSVACQIVREAYPNIQPSLLNSSGMLIWPEIKQQAPDLAEAEFGHILARPGHTLYGDNPLCGTPREALGAGFFPVMETRSSVLAVRTVHKGDSLSYGHTFTAEKDMRIAIIAAGYAGGYPRSLSDKGYVAFRGGRAPIVGRVCMQMTFVDVSHLPSVRSEDPVWLLGGPNDGITKSITAFELAQWASMIAYEITCAFGKNERTYVD
jgi:alanine racemase